LSVCIVVVRLEIEHYRFQEETEMNTQSHSATDEAKIRTLIDQRINAQHAKDAKALLSFLTGDFVSFSLAPPLISAMRDKKDYDAWFATWQGPISTEVRDLTISVSGDLGTSHSLNLMSGTSADGQDVRLWYRQTLIFRKAGGAWKVAHQHDSVPFYMDGGFRAAIDLKP
jgi:PhnB protein